MGAVSDLRHGWSSFPHPVQTPAGQRRHFQGAGGHRSALCRQKVVWRSSSSSRDDQDVEDEGATDLRPAGGPAASSRPPLPPPRSPAPSAAAGAATSQTNINSCLPVCLSVWLWTCVCSDQISVSAPPVRLQSSAAGQDLQQHLRHMTARLNHHKATFTRFMSVSSTPHQGTPMSWLWHLACFVFKSTKTQHFLGKAWIEKTILVLLTVLKINKLFIYVIIRILVFSCYYILQKKKECLSFFFCIPWLFFLISSCHSVFMKLWTV